MLLYHQIQKKICNIIGFIAHYGYSSSSQVGENVNPIIHENYDGKDIVLNEENNIILSIKDFP